MTEHVLSYMVFIPLAGMLVVLCLPSDRHDLIRWVSAAATVPPLLLGIWLYANFDTTTTSMQFVERAAWIPAFNIEYYVGVDGLSVSMVLLTALLSFLCIFASWGIDKGVKGYFALFLLLDTGMTGVFVALDFVLFYVFWEVMAASHVLPHRHLGRPAQGVRRHQVLPLHAAGQRAHAGGHPGRCTSTPSPTPST